MEVTWAIEAETFPFGDDCLASGKTSKASRVEDQPASSASGRYQGAPRFLSNSKPVSSIDNNSLACKCMDRSANCNTSKPARSTTVYFIYAAASKSPVLSSTSSIDLHDFYLDFKLSWLQACSCNHIQKSASFSS